MKTYNNKQEIFDKVAKHMLTQNRKSVIGNTCAYFADDGTKCAVGCLIPPTIYDPLMEKTGAIANVMSEAMANKFSFKKKTNEWLVENFSEHMPLLASLQLAHDQMEVINWKVNLKGIASAYNIEWKYEEF